MMEGIEDGGCGAVDNDEEGEEDDKWNEAGEEDEGHGCMGEGEGVNTVVDSTRGVRDIMGDGMASALGVKHGTMGVGVTVGVGIGALGVEDGTKGGVGVTVVVGIGALGVEDGTKGVGVTVVVGIDAVADAVESIQSLNKM
ncbi:TPA: hypothetical protein ACH3X1_005770 [Trebouxia sp. C0004]